MSVVLITGCSSGFGESIALEFARSGAQVYASMRNISKAEVLLNKAEDEQLNIEVIELDVCKPSSINAAAERVLRDSGRLDVLINNAGVAINGVAEEITDVAARRIIDTNFFGCVNLTRAFLPAMRRQRSGTIVMLSSLSALCGLPGDAFYAASKAALERFSESLSYEVKPFGIQLKVVRPGAFDTALSGKMLCSKDLSNSEYKALTKHMQNAIRDNMGKGDTPSLLAARIVEIVSTNDQGLYFEIGEQATGVVEKFANIDESQRGQLLTEISGIGWWLDEQF